MIFSEQFIIGPSASNPTTGPLGICTPLVKSFSKSSLSRCKAEFHDASRAIRTRQACVRGDSNQLNELKVGEERKLTTEVVKMHQRAKPWCVGCTLNIDAGVNGHFCTRVI